MMDYMKKILKWLPRKYLVHCYWYVFNGFRFQLLFLPLFRFNRCFIHFKSWGISKNSNRGVLSYSLLFDLGLFIYGEDSQQRMIKQLTLTQKRKIITVSLWKV